MKKLSSKFPGKKILVVEDYYINQQLTRDVLEIMECVVEIAENGQVAIEKCKESHYDLILMDVHMPEKDGYSATREIRQLQEKQSKRSFIVALTAKAMEGDKEECLASGMDDYLCKPMDFEQLEAILNRYLS